MLHLGVCEGEADAKGQGLRVREAVRLYICARTRTLTRVHVYESVFGGVCVDVWVRVDFAP